MKLYNLKNREMYEESLVRQGYEVDYHFTMYESTESGAVVNLTMHLHELESREIVYVTEIQLDTSKGDFIYQDHIINEITDTLENWDGCLAD